jgi:hypothetical protein
MSMRKTAAPPAPAAQRRVWLPRTIRARRSAGRQADHYVEHATSDALGIVDGEPPELRDEPVREDARRSGSSNSSQR